MATATRSNETLYTTSCSWGECDVDETSMTFRCEITVDFSKWYGNHPGGASISCNPRTFIWAQKYWDDDSPDVLRVDMRDITVTASEPVFTAEIEHTLQKSSSKTFDVYMGLAVYNNSESNSIASTEVLKYNSKAGSTTAWTGAKTMAKSTGSISVTVIPVSSSPLITTAVTIDGIVADDASSKEYTLPSAVTSEEEEIASRMKLTGWYVDWRPDAAASDVVKVDYVLKPGDTFKYCNIHSKYGITEFKPKWESIGDVKTGKFLADDEAATVLFTIDYIEGEEVIIPDSFRIKDTANATFLGWTYDYKTAYQPGDSLGNMEGDFEIAAWMQYFEDATNPRKIWVYCKEKDRWIMGDPWIYRLSSNTWV